MGAIFTPPALAGQNVFAAGHQRGVSGTPIGSLEVGASVYMNVDGVSTEFLVVHQGNPDTNLYDESCNGTWLLMKDVYASKYMNGTSSDYSSMDSYLNSTFLAKLNARVQSHIKTIRIPYLATAYSSAVSKGSNGLECKIFLISYYEVFTGFTTVGNDGIQLSYFTSHSTDKDRVAYLAGNAVAWWTRTRYSASYYYFKVTGVRESGNGTHGVRPSMILEPDNLVDAVGNIIT